MRLAVVLLRYVWLEVLCTGPLDLPQLTSERRATYHVQQIAWFPWRMHVNRGPSALVGLTLRFSSALDASTSVFLLSFVKNLALIATSSWIRRCGGVAVEVDPMSRRSWPSGWRVHGGRTPTGFVATGSCLAVLPRPRCAWLPRSVAVGKADETLNGGPPLVDLVFRWRVIQEQLSSRQGFCWSGGRQWRTVRGAGYARTSNYVRRSSIPSRRPCLARASTLACMQVLSTPRSTGSILAQQTYGTASTMTLSVSRLLRWARCVYGRQGLCSLVLGPGSIVSFLVDVRSSAGVYSTTRLLRRWWK